MFCCHYMSTLKGLFNSYHLSPTVFCCLYCGSDYSADRSLKRHYQSFPEHRPSSANVYEHAGNNVKPANVSVKEFWRMVAICMTMYELFTNLLYS